MKTFLLSFLLPALASTSFAAAPQFKSRTDITTGFKYLYGMVVADFNGDGKPDIAVTDNNVKAVQVYLNDGTGAFTSPKPTPIVMDALGPGQLLAGDFNEDGKQDLIVDTVAGLQADILLIGNGDGTFTQKQNLPGSYGYVSGIAVDVNGDKHLDLIFGGNGSTSSYIGDGKGGFQQVTSPNLGGGSLYTGVVSDDFNKDGKNDVVIASPVPTSAVIYHPGNGDGTFNTPTTLSTSSYPQPRSLASADFNADGNPDLMLSAQFVTVALFGKGDGTFDTSSPSYFYTPIPSKFDSSSYAAVVAAVDMDGDKKVDGVVADDLSQTVNIFLNDGTGKFLQTTPDFSAAIDQGVAGMAVTDLNGDGTPDIVVANNITQNISVFLSIKPKIAAAAALIANANPQLVGSSVTFTAKITSTGNNVPTGTVTLLDGTSSLGQQTLDANAQATFSMSNLSVGQHSLTISYSGDNNFLPATSSAITQSIADFQVALPIASQTITAGGTAPYSLTVTPAGGLTGTISITCAQLPSLASCDPVTVPLTGQPATATLTVHTTAPVSSKNRSKINAANLSLTAIAFTMLVPLRRRRPIQLLAVTVALALIGSTTGCSGGSTKSTTTTAGTPQGTTQFTITSSVTLGGQTLTRTSTATLVVQ
ncbi:VCBS repeat-containing protein [Edaphobacter sp. HDX4]|uniref:FG-GAP-like repeat-containing protein n=1 Tax=Edaphobacter sp. HDX4 TaxID=2794064 RepID=UPI002FE6365C